jgi:hypothetical protein
MGQLVDGIHVAVELPLLRQQVFHQGTVERIPLQTAQQQLAEGAQGRERVAQLMHQQPELVVLLGQGAAEPLLFEVQAEGLGEAAGRGLEPVCQGLGPGPLAAVHPQGAHQLGTIAQGSQRRVTAWGGLARSRAVGSSPATNTWAESGQWPMGSRAGLPLSEGMVR